MMGDTCGATPPANLPGSDCILDADHDGPHQDTEGIQFAELVVESGLTAERVDSTLIANGFVTLRKEALAVIGAMAGWEVELIDVMLAYVERKRNSTELRGQPAEVGDNLDLDRWRLEALRTFRLELDEVERRWQARRELRG